MVSYESLILCTQSQSEFFSLNDRNFRKKYMSDQQGFVKQALDSWKGQVSGMDATLQKLSDEQLMQEVAPNRNRGIYLLGHLAAVHDMMLPLLRFEDAL